MPDSYTPRGFAMFAGFEYSDYEGVEPQQFTVQASSLATERKVWVGRGSDRAHLNEDEARRVRDALSEFLEDDQTALIKDPGVRSEHGVRAQAYEDAAAACNSEMWAAWLLRLAADERAKGRTTDG